MHEKFRIGKFPGIQGSYEMDSYAPGSSYRRLYLSQPVYGGQNGSGQLRQTEDQYALQFYRHCQTRKDDYDKENYYCYIGRLSPEKGIGTLIEAAKRLPYPLKIIGGGSLEETLRAAAAGSDIELLGYKHWPEIKEIVGKARFCVVPSEWYENNPLSVIESQCLGTPVLGSRIGGIPELIDEGKTGMLFESGNAKELKARIGQMFATPFEYRQNLTRRPEKIFGRKVLCKTPENIHFFIIRQKRSVFLQNGIDKYESFDLNRHCQSNMHYPGCHRSLQSG